jgi:hypothetical protein
VNANPANVNEIGVLSAFGKGLRPVIKMMLLSHGKPVPIRMTEIWLL